VKTYGPRGRKTHVLQHGEKATPDFTLLGGTPVYDVSMLEDKLELLPSQP
jgi:hypothetical protein